MAEREVLSAIFCQELTARPLYPELQMASCDRNSQDQKPIVRRSEIVIKHCANMSWMRGKSWEMLIAPCTREGHWDRGVVTNQQKCDILLQGTGNRRFDSSAPRLLQRKGPEKGRVCFMAKTCSKRWFGLEKWIGTELRWTCWKILTLVSFWIYRVS